MRLAKSFDAAKRYDPCRSKTRKTHISQNRGIRVTLHNLPNNQAQGLGVQNYTPDPKFTRHHQHPVDSAVPLLRPCSCTRSVSPDAADPPAPNATQPSKFTSPWRPSAVAANTHSLRASLACLAGRSVQPQRVGPARALVKSTDTDRPVSADLTPPPSLQLGLNQQGPAPFSNTDFT